jgi:hypothetical protein
MIPDDYKNPYDNPYLLYAAGCVVISLLMYLFNKIGLQYQYQPGGTKFLMYAFAVLSVLNIVFYFLRIEEIKEIKKRNHDS